MNFVKYQGTTKPFKDFDEMCDWMKHTDGFPCSIMMSNGLRHMLERVGTAFIDVNGGTLVTSEQVYNMPPTYRILHVMTIFQADDMSGLEYTFNVSLNINGLDKSEIMRLSDTMMSLVGESKQAPDYPVCDFNLPDLGLTINLFGYKWMVCHDDGSRKYLITDHIVKETRWNASDTTQGGYMKSKIRHECNLFAISTGIDKVDYIEDLGVGKVFIPTKHQIYGGFSWFTEADKRVAKYNNNNTKSYWLATPRDESTVWEVNQYGEFRYCHAYCAYNGFRPCICIRYK